jgi:TrmH family RNA methyltransferase
MISKSEISLVTSLAHKKYRDELGLFVIEGEKMLEEAKASTFAIRKIFIEDEISPVSMKKISNFKTPSSVLAVIEQPSYNFDLQSLYGDLSLVLDGVQDPGNMGTIIRLADWFGIKNIICSPDAVDCYNPKVVQATMGAIFRVKVHYSELPILLKEVSHHIPVYGTTLDGKNIYEQELQQGAMLVMGSEGKGISEDVMSTLTSRLYIPPFHTVDAGSESLNVAISTAIVCAEFRRRMV